MSFPLLASLLGILCTATLIFRARRYEPARRRETVYGSLGLFCLCVALLVNEIAPHGTATTVASILLATGSMAFLVLEWRLWRKLRANT